MTMNVNTGSFTPTPPIPASTSYQTFKPTVPQSAPAPAMPAAVKSPPPQLNQTAPVFKPGGVGAKTENEAPKMNLGSGSFIPGAPPGNQSAPAYNPQ